MEILRSAEPSGNRDVTNRHSHFVPERPRHTTNGRLQFCEYFRL
jgi:hypothetical protein